MISKPVAGIAFAVLTAAVVLTGCGDDNPDTSPATDTATTSPVASGAATESVAGNHNQADIRFAQEMIPHHRQAVEMAALVPSHSSDPEVNDLAARIQRAQDPEIATMAGWLQAWGVATPEGGEHSGMGHATMPGMMTDEQMAQLEAARGPEFDRMWLTMMIAHHEGAVRMADTELAEGANPDAEALAQRIIDAQQAEIQQMQDMLNG
ncbi:DUF305 domain-containing protein [Nocardia jinanensis]|uniref:DUF305 domain-containing protein n=1 Tax=Nocardia jinanensis TaxID=382504 RepID=A0A917RDT6_9NOCA|nr:DUF305 domain-containing protein [Nocardia jinanensis]GGL01064.1 hypothetical protein GCM10011588_14660 [Nocardia jinanensis]